jgi:hypothetical protein
LKFPSSEILSSLVLLTTLGLTPSLPAQQPQTARTPTSTKWFPPSPVGMQGSSALATQTEMEPMSLVAPIFFEDSHNSSSLVIANSTAMPAGATITVRSLSGREVGTVHKRLAPHEQQEIPLQSLLAQFASPIGAGSITVTQDANLKGMAIAAQLLLTKFKTSLPSYIDEELAMPSVSGSATLRGVADEAAGTAVIAITSIVNWEQHVTLRCLSDKAEPKPATLTLAPYATSVVSSCSGELLADMESYAQAISQHQASAIQGYELVTDGGPGAIAAFGLAPHLRNQDLVFSAIPFTDPAEVHSPNSVFAGVPFGAQDALPNGVYKPRISFTNFAVTPAHVTVSIAATRPGDVPVSATPGDIPEKVAIRQLTIAPRRSVELALSDTVSQSGLLQSLFVETDKKPGEVLGKAVSRSDGNLYEVELLEKDEMDENNGGIHPWSVEGDTESHLLFFNHSKKPQVFGVGISSGAILWDKKYTLAPNETREISINELIQDKVPDEKGRTLSWKLQRGVVNWMVPDSGNGTGRLMVTSRSKGMARNFSCGNFLVVCGFYFDTYDNGYIPVSSTGDLWSASPQFCLEWGPGQCSGGTQVGWGTASYNWTIGATSIIKATSSSQLTLQSPQVTGVAAGSGSGYANVEAGGCQSGGSGPGVVASVTISGADIDSNVVTVVLAPSGAAPGPLSIAATGAGASYTYSYQGGAAVGAGTYSVALPRPSIPAGTYTTLTATWNPGQPVTGTYTLVDKWIILGTIRHSQYNTIYESTCPSTTSLTYLATTSCVWTTDSLSSQFVSQVEINGSGISAKHGPVKYDLGSCPNRPAGSTSSNTLYLVPSITGQCNVPLVGGDSQATYPGPKDAGSKFNCGDDTTLVDAGNVNRYMKHIEDRCAGTAQGCLDGHIDNYSSAQGCSPKAVGYDLPLSPLWTVDY